MKKLIFMMLMAFSAIVANAQTAVQSSKILDNVYVGIDGGVATPLTFSNVFPLNGTATLRVGKQFTPVWGAEVEGTAWFGSNSGYGFLSTPNRFDGASHNVVRGTYVGVNGTVNLTNLFGGYKGTPRLFEVSTVLGTVKVVAYASPEGTESYNKKLSQRRANAVADYLRAKGVTVTEVYGAGVNGNTSNRIAIVTVQ